LKESCNWQSIENKIVEINTIGAIPICTNALSDNVYGPIHVADHFPMGISDWSVYGYRRIYPPGFTGITRWDVRVITGTRVVLPVKYPRFFKNCSKT
jgi:hypothetical protein